MPWRNAAAEAEAAPSCKFASRSNAAGRHAAFRAEDADADAEAVALPSHERVLEVAGEGVARRARRTACRRDAARGWLPSFHLKTRASLVAHRRAALVALHFALELLPLERLARAYRRAEAANLRGRAVAAFGRPARASPAGSMNISCAPINILSSNINIVAAFLYSVDYVYVHTLEYSTRTSSLS